MFDQLPESSKVWVYQSDRDLTANECDALSNDLKLFIQDWAAHGSKLYGDFSIINNRFVILAVDETMTGVSGCSIDTSVRKMKELGSNLKIDFFNRMNLILEKEGEFKTVHVSDVKKFDSWNVFNPMITNLAQLRSEWKVPVTQSPFF